MLCAMLWEDRVVRNMNSQRGVAQAFKVLTFGGGGIQFSISFRWIDESEQSEQKN